MDVTRCYIVGIIAFGICDTVRGTTHIPRGDIPIRYARNSFTSSHLNTESFHRQGGAAMRQGRVIPTLDQCLLEST